MAEHTPVTDEAVRVAQAADDQYATDTRPTNFQALSEGRVRYLLEAAAPLITDTKLAAIRPLVAQWRTAAKHLASINSVWSSHFNARANELERLLDAEASDG